MVKNVYEHTLIKNNKLPVEWQDQKSLDELLQFLQQNWSLRSSFYNDEKVESRQQFLDFLGNKSIRTKNYIGTIVFKGQQLNIFPKVFGVDSTDDDTDDLSLKHLMRNLVQWIDYCNKVSYPYINISAELDDSNDLRELFITLYTNYVKHAIDRGLFYRYEDKVEDCSKIKGKIDIKDYFINKIPNGNIDKFKCSFSVFEVDNIINKIIKYTCKELLNQTNNVNQKRIRYILTKLNEVTDCRCSPIDCDNIRLSRLHRNYEVILSMSKMFLLNKTSNFNIDNNDSFCFLFPTELLFEGFIGGFMQSVLEKHATVKLQASDRSVFSKVIYRNKDLGKAIQMRHDILVEHKEKGLFILDTKYKLIDRFDSSADVREIVRTEANTSDIYQVLTYARSRSLKNIYLLYPQFRYEDLESDKPPVGINTTNIDGEEVNVHFVRLPFVFEEDVEETKLKLKKVIIDLFD